MNLFKKILFSFLLFTLALTTISFLFSEKVHATGVNTVRVKAYSDTNNDHYWQEGESAIAVPITFIGSDGSKTGTTKTTATRTDSPNTGELFFLTSRTNNSVELKNKAINGVYIHDDTHQRSWGLGSRALINTVGSATVYYAVKPCVRNNPSLSKTAVTPNPDKNTDNRVYYLTVKNNDSANCSLRSFQLNREIPSGWFATYSRLNQSSALLSIDLDPGETEKVKLKVTPLNNASGDNNIIASAKAGSNKSNNVTLEYNLGSNLVCNRDPEFKVTDAKDLKNPDRTVYDLSLRNKDDAGCKNSTFNLDTLDLPSAWNTPFTYGTLNNEKISINLDPGLARTFSLKVQPPANATAKAYPFKIQAQDTENLGSKDVIIKTYMVTADGGGNDPCDNNSQCSNGKFCKNPDLNTSKCVECLNDNQCSGNKKCNTNNVCAIPDTGNACNPNPPGLAITDPTNKTRSGEAGAEKEYTVKVTNKDTGDCSPKTFILTKEQLPNNNWSASFSTNNISLNKGASKEGIILKVKSPTTASAGEKPVSIGVKKSGQTNAQVKTNLTYIVKGANISRAPSNGPSNGPSRNPSISPTACQRKTPVIQVTQNKNAVKPKGQIIYTIVISNNDSANCADKALKLSATVPNDSWTKTLSKNELSMRPGGNTSVILTVDSPNFSTVGNKDVKFIIKNGSGATLLTTPLSFIISEEPTTVSPPISPIISPIISPEISGTISQPISPTPDNALLDFILGLDGIGTTERINIGGNKNPIDAGRELKFQIRNPLTNEVIYDSEQTTFTYDSGKEKFISSYVLPSNIANGTYNVFVYGSPYISRRYPVSVNITKGQTTNLNSPQFYMVAGNIDDGGQSHDFIDIRDYNVLMSCSIFSKDSTVCDSDPNFLKYSDLNSDGLIDQSDYTLWLKEKSKQKGDLPE